MAETHHAVLNGIETIVTDPEPLPSAVLFKRLSDKLLAINPPKEDEVVTQLSMTETAEASLSILKRALFPISDKFVAPVPGQDVRLANPAGPELILKSSNLQTRTGWLQTLSWDSLRTARRLRRAEGIDVYRFSDGHCDYYREISACLPFDVLDEELRLEYRMQRKQEEQDQPATLNVALWYSGFFATGYEGGTVHHQIISPDQEAALLRAMAYLADISLDD